MPALIPMHYVKIKRERHGVCNICGCERPLSWDHVPPKGGIDLQPVEMETVFQRLTYREGKRAVMQSQNGVKFRTICAECNSLLGRRYDPILNEFAKGIGKYLNTTLTLPPILHHLTQPGSLIRAILGHLLAAKGEPDEVVFDQHIRPCVLDEQVPIPEDVFVFYWLYPYSETVVIRDILMPAVRGQLTPTGFFHILKYFPVAYLVTNLHQYESLLELTRFRTLDPTTESEIPIDLSRVEHQQWPELVDDKNFLFGGRALQSSISAVPRKRRR